jgi:hypothetical protein
VKSPEVSVGQTYIFLVDPSAAGKEKFLEMSKSMDVPKGPIGKDGTNLGEYYNHQPGCLITACTSLEWSVEARSRRCHVRLRCEWVRQRL